jgi:hypothetical protein
MRTLNPGELVGGLRLRVDEFQPFAADAARPQGDPRRGSCPAVVSHPTLSRRTGRRAGRRGGYRMPTGPSGNMRVGRDVLEHLRRTPASSSMTWDCACLHQPARTRNREPQAASVCGFSIRGYGSWRGGRLKCRMCNSRRCGEAAGLGSSRTTMDPRRSTRQLRPRAPRDPRSPGDNLRP